MADSSLAPPMDGGHDATEVINDLDTMIESVELMSVQITWMAYDMAVLRTNTELEASMRLLQEAYQRCRSVLLREKEAQIHSNMETKEKPSESVTSAASAAAVNLENILQELNVLSDCMNQLALHTQLSLCDLIVCVGHPDKQPSQKVHKILEQQQNHHDHP